MAAGASAAFDAAPYEQALAQVDPSASPRVQLTWPRGRAVGAPQSLAVLDSSFNPPTSAHLHLLQEASQRFGATHRLLLLAKNNADKAVSGATLAQRLKMMELLARSDDGKDGSSAIADADACATLCGVTAHPLFVDKACALQTLCGDDARIFMLVGFDTWMRITDPKYYPSGTLDDVLRSIFSKVEIVVASRDPSSASSLKGVSFEQQEAQIGKLSTEITRGRLHFLRTGEGMAALSSSAARDAFAQHDEQRALGMVPACVHDFIVQQQLYK